MAIETLFLAIFDPRSSIVKSVFRLLPIWCGRGANKTTHLKNACDTQIVEYGYKDVSCSHSCDDKGHRDPPIHRAVHVHLSRRAQDRYS